MYHEQEAEEGDACHAQDAEERDADGAHDDINAGPFFNVNGGDCGA